MIDLYEGPETIDLEFTALDGTVAATALIRDRDEAPTVAFETSRPVTVAEGSTVTLLVVLNGTLAESDIVVDFTVSGTADEGVDYSSLERSVTIPSGETSTIVSIFVADDQLTEGAETLELRLLSASAGVNVATPNVVGVTIIDNDEAPVVPELPEVVVVTATLGVSELSISEGKSENLYINLSEATSEDVTLTLTVVDGGRAVVTVDYATLLVPAVIRAGLSELTVSIRTLEDELIEETEIFELRLSVMDGPAVTGALDRVTVSIIDNDKTHTMPKPPEVVVVTATLSTARLAVEEGNGVTLTVTLDGALEVTVTVSLLTGATSTAEANDDYTLLPRTFRIESGQTIAIFRLNALSDEIYEGNEQLVLVPRATGVGLVDIVAEPATFTIVNRTPLPVLSLDPIADVHEGDGFTVVVRLSGALAVPLTIPLTVELDGALDSAEVGDYGALPRTITIPAGATTVALTRLAIDDDVYEGDERLTLRLDTATLTVGFGTVEQEFTIIDDEVQPTVSLISLGQVAEGDDLTVTVRLSRALEVAVTVELSATNESAESDDYTISPSSMMVTIPAGQREEEFILTALADPVHAHL